MSKENEKMPLGQKIAYGVGAVGVAAALVSVPIAVDASGDEKAVKEQLADKTSEITSLQSQLDNQEITIDEFKAKIESLGIEVADLKEASETDKQVIADYEAEKIALEAELAEKEIEAETPTVFVGFDKDFGLGEAIELDLNDNQLAKLADYEVDVDGEDVAVKEFLEVAGEFNREDSLSLNFEEESIKYIIEYDKDAAEINEEDSLDINLLGQAVQIVGVEDGKLTIKTMEDKFVKTGESLNGVEVLKISEDAVLVKVGDQLELLDEGTHEVNDVEIEVGAILYIEGDADNMVNLKAGEELEKVYKLTGDDKFYDEDEVWKFSEIEEGRIVLTNDEEFEEVSEVVLPNDFAKISFDVDDVEYQDVKVEKEDGVITKVFFDLEDYDSTYAEFEDGEWVAEDDEEEIDFEAGVALKDSDFVLVLKEGKAIVRNEEGDNLVRVMADEVKIDGETDFDNDENFYSVDGLVVEPTEDFLDEEDESIVIEVPEETVEATILVE